MRMIARVAAAAACAVLSGCYHLNKSDIFEVAFAPVQPRSLRDMSDADHHVRSLSIRAAGREVSAYWDDGKDARGVLIFFDGNGYGAEIALRRLLAPARALHLDLVAFDYFDRGQTPPSMADMRAIEDALFAAASSLPVSAARTIYAGGHSVGATFALELAGRHHLAGVFLAAPVSTGIAMIHHQIPYSRLIRLLPDEDYRQFDNLKLAPMVRSPVIVFGSDHDTDLPPEFTNAVYAALPVRIRKQEVILHGVVHSGYLADETFWRDVANFFGLAINGPLVGYIRPGTPIH